MSSIGFYFVYLFAVLISCYIQSIFVLFLSNNTFSPLATELMCKLKLYFTMSLDNCTDLFSIISSIYTQGTVEVFNNRNFSFKENLNVAGRINAALLIKENLSFSKNLSLKYKYWYTARHFWMHILVLTSNLVIFFS